MASTNDCCKYKYFHYRHYSFHHQITGIFVKKKIVLKWLIYFNFQYNIKYLILIDPLVILFASFIINVITYDKSTFMIINYVGYLSTET